MAVNTQGFGIQLATGGFSLEANTIFSSYALALAYAKSSAAYEGKVISVTSGAEKGAYIVEAIGENASLKKVGSDVDLSNYVTKDQLTNVYTYKGSKDNYSDLPNNNSEVTPIIGDVWNVINEYTSLIDDKYYPSGTNWVWNGSEWDPLGGSINLSNYATKEELNTKVTALDGYSLISLEKLDLIDTNATNIQTLEEAFKNTGGNVDLSQINSVISEHANKIETLELSNIELEKELANKAPKVGYAPDLKVDFAKKLIGRGVAEPQEIGTIRPTGVISIGDGNATIEKVKGKSVVWNQYYKIITKDTTLNGVTFVNNNDGTVTVYTDEGGATANVYVPNNSYNAKEGTVLYLTGCPTGGSTDGYYHYITGPSMIVDTGKGIIRSAKEGIYYTAIMVKTGTIITTPIVFYPRLYDLTKMFGAGNEPTTIEEFEARKPLGVTDDYNEGEIISYDAKELKSVGFNAFNGSYAKVIGGQQYHALGTITSIGFTTELDGETTEITLNSEGMFTPLETGYVYAEGSDICIHLTHTYTPEHTNKYEEDILLLPSIKDIKDKDGNQLFPYGLLSIGGIYDEITEKKVVKRLKHIEFNGSEPWYLHSVNDLNIANFYFVDTSINSNLKGICDKFIIQSSLIANTTSEGFMFAISYIYICLKSSKASTITQFKQWLQENPINFVIELTEPIEVDLPEPLNLTYDAWDFGTEELITEGKTTPLNADIVYQFNAVDKIRENTANINEIEELYTTKELTNSITEQLTNKQDTLTIEVLDNGNIRINNLEGGSKEFVSGEMLSSLATKAEVEYLIETINTQLSAI